MTHDAAAAAPVVLVHGLWMHGLAMQPLRWQLERQGFSAHCFSYPSLSASLQQNLERLVAFIRAIGADRAHLVGHSLGGVLILRALDLLGPGPVGRAVCLGSPLTGSSAARVLAGWPAGPALLGQTLREAVLEQPLHRCTAATEVGVIAGSLPLGAGRILQALDGENDGAVAVAETRLPHISDHLVLPVSHAGLLVAPSVAQQTGHFLVHGRFCRDRAAEA